MIKTATHVKEIGAFFLNITRQYTHTTYVCAVQGLYAQGKINDAGKTRWIKQL